MARLLYCDGVEYHGAPFVLPPPPDPDPGGGDLPADIQEAIDLIVAGAGLQVDPGELEARGTIEVTTNGAVVEGFDLSGGIINVKANDVEVRNCRLASYSGVFLIRFWPGYSGGLVEYCDVEGTPNPADPTQGAAGAIGGTGSNPGVTIQYNHVHGNCDGFKPMQGTLIYRNHVNVAKASGSDAHRDCLQASADQDMRCYENYMQLDMDTGGNTGIFLQAWNGANNIPTFRGYIERNICQGGNRGIEVRGGKHDKPLPDGYSNADELVQDCRIIDNHLIGPFRHPPWTVVNTASHVISGNTYNGAPWPLEA